MPGRGVGLHLDLNFNFKTEGYIRLAQALEPFDLVWLEIDSYDPAALATIRRSARTRVASLESLYGRRQFRPFFEQQSVDVAIIDVAWNGILESMKIASMADAYEVNVAPHNFNGHIGSLMSAHMCAAIPNFRVMEIDIEDVPWKDELVTPVPVIENGELVLPTGPGWGVEVNEDGDPRASAAADGAMGALSRRKAGPRPRYASGRAIHPHQRTRHQQRQDHAHAEAPAAVDQQRAGDRPGVPPAGDRVAFDRCDDEHADQRCDHSEDQTAQPHRPGEARHEKTEHDSVKSAPEAQADDDRDTERRHGRGAERQRTAPNPIACKRRDHPLVERQHRDRRGNETQKGPHWGLLHDGCSLGLPGSGLVAA